MVDIAMRNVSGIESPSANKSVSLGFRCELYAIYELIILVETIANKISRA